MLGAASGVLAALSFRSPTQAPLVFVALVPFLFAAARGPAAGALGGAALGIVGYATTFAWMPEPLTRFQSISLLIAWSALGLSVAYHSVQFMLFGAAFGAFERARRVAPAGIGRGALGLLGPAAIWALLEWGFPKVFPWSLGGALAPHDVLRQAADLGGVHGLGFAILVVNTGLALGLDARSSRLVRLASVAAAVAVISALAGYGSYRLTAAQAVATRDEDGVLVAVLQAALPPRHLDRDAATRGAWRAYERLTAAALSDASAAGGRPDVLIWPETTLPVYLRTDAWARATVEQYVTGIGRPLIVGALDRADDTAGAGEYNAAFAFQSGPPEFDGGGVNVQTYRKNYLVPWAEYLPGARWLPFLRRWRTTGAFTAGADRQSFSIMRPGRNSTVLRIAPSICVESLQAGWFNALVRDGAEVLLNLTDDGWLADSPGPDLHLQLARLRAVETRRWLVRASNSGVSAVIDPNGALVASLPFGAAGALVQRVVPLHGLTPYVRWGEWVIAGSALLLSLAGLVHVRAWSRR